MNKLIAYFTICIGFAAALPVQEKILKPLTFHVTEEWNLVPDSNGRLRMLHESEIVDPEEMGLFFKPEKDIKFLLFTKSETKGFRILFENETSLAESGFNKKYPVRFVIHGWNNDVSSEINQAITEAYRIKGDFSTIVVDWGKAANTVNYISARNNVAAVGKTVAKFIDFLVSKSGIKSTQISIAGHSLGAHISGITGKYVTSGQIHTIVGLDPAGPLFSLSAKNERINKGDAEYVEIIHTNGGTLGFWDPLGDVDFYPNGGSSQKGCGIDLVGTCAHSRSHQYFAESINLFSRFTGIPCNITGISNGKCDEDGKPAKMGGEPSNHGNGLDGIYYLTTNNAVPFALG